MHEILRQKLDITLSLTKLCYLQNNDNDDDDDDDDDGNGEFLSITILLGVIH